MDEVCNQCGELRLEGMRICGACGGMEFVPASESPEPQPEPVRGPDRGPDREEPPPLPLPQTCGFADCGARIPGGLAFCPYCGREQAGAATDAAGPAGAVSLVTPTGAAIALRPGVVVHLGRSPEFSPYADDLNRPNVSRRHCTVEWRDAVMLVTDLETPNGTFVDDQRLAGSAEVPVRAGLQLRLGASLTLEVRC